MATCQRGMQGGRALAKENLPVSGMYGTFPAVQQGCSCTHPLPLLPLGPCRQARWACYGGGQVKYGGGSGRADGVRNAPLAPPLRVRPSRPAVTPRTAKAPPLATPIVVGEVTLPPPARSRAPLSALCSSPARPSFLSVRPFSAAFPACPVSSLPAGPLCNPSRAPRP